MCSPLWISPHWQRGVSIFPIWCSHCLCGPLLVRIHMYANAESSWRFQRGLFPFPRLGWQRCSLLSALPNALRPSYVTMLDGLVISPKYNPCPKVLVKARFQPIERHQLNAAISPNLLNNSITTSRPGLKLKTEIQQIMENQK